MVLEGKKNNTIVDLWNSSPADQDRADILWSTSDETSLQYLIRNYITKDKTPFGQERRNASQAYHKKEDSTVVMI